MKLLPPSGPERRRQLILLGAVILFGGVAWWYYGAPASPAAPAAAPGRTPPAAATQAATPSSPSNSQAREGSAMPVPLKLAALEDVPEAGESGRNPFGYGVKPPPPPPPYVPPPPQPPPPPQKPPEPAGPPPIQLKVVGISTLTENGKPLAQLKDPASGATFLAFEGDIVDGKYKVVKVGLTSVTVSYLDGTGQRIIPLG